MDDDFNTPHWVDHRHRLAEAIHKGIALLGAALECLNARQFDAPWRPRRDAAPRATGTRPA